MSNLRTLLIALIVALPVVATGFQSTYAIDNGDNNGYDGNNYCSFCDDNPYDDTGTYSVNNGQHDFMLKEWVEPHYDKLREQDMQWGASAETKLNNECVDRFLTFEQRIKDQYYYGLKMPVVYGTNLPVDGGPASENIPEELIQGYSEFDTESHECQLIQQNTIYFLQFRVGSERYPSTTEPDFHSEIEWCHDINPFDCKHDETGRFRKKVRQK